MASPRTTGLGGFEAPSSKGDTLRSDQSSLNVGVLHLLPSLEVFPLLADPKSYWFTLLSEHLPDLVDKAVASEGGTDDAKRRGDAFARAFSAHLARLMEEPAAYGKLGLANLLELREECLREFNFFDAYRTIKQRENEASLAALPDLLMELDNTSEETRLLTLIEGVLAANIFDWGSLACVDLYHSGTIIEIYRMSRKKMQRPWRADNFDAFKERMSFGAHKRPLLFVDNSGAAKSQDEEGRLHFCFRSFVSFNSAIRTILALWKTRSSSPDQKMDSFHEDQDGDEKIGWEQHEQDDKGLYEDVTSHFVVEDAKMSKVYSTELQINVESMMEIFKGGNLEHRVMVKLSCLNYNTTNWEPVTSGSDVFERRLCYKFNRRVSSFGGDVTCTQQKSPFTDGKGWIVTEAMSLHDVPFGDHFYVQVKYEVREGRQGWCVCDVYVGVVWLKNCKFEERITRNIIVKFGDRIREMFELVEREMLLAIDGSRL